MSSKGGSRAAGTDGSDFQHREQVASQYKISAQMKSTFRTCLLINIAIVSLQLLALTAAHFRIFEVAADIDPVQWQITWMLSGVVSLLGLNALRKNDAAMLKLHNLGLMIFGFGGIFFGFMSQYASYQRHLITGQTKHVADTPIYVVWTVVLGFVTLHYLVTIYYSMRLQSAWSLRKAR